MRGCHILIYHENYFLGFQCNILSIKIYINNTINNKLKNALKKEPILMFAEPMGRTISSHIIDLLEISGRIIGRIISLTIDCTKFKAAMPTINATEIAMILYSLRNSANLLKSIIINKISLSI